MRYQVPTRLARVKVVEDVAEKVSHTWYLVGGSVNGSRWEGGAGPGTQQFRFQICALEKLCLCLSGNMDEIVQPSSLRQPKARNSPGVHPQGDEQMSGGTTVKTKWTKWTPALLSGRNHPNIRQSHKGKFTMEHTARSSYMIKLDTRCSV
jgi:hypothetical protein